VRAGQVQSEARRAREEPGNVARAGQQVVDELTPRRDLLTHHATSRLRISRGQRGERVIERAQHAFPRRRHCWRVSCRSHGGKAPPQPAGRGQVQVQQSRQRRARARRAFAASPLHLAPRQTPPGSRSSGQRRQKLAQQLGIQPARVGGGRDGDLTQRRVRLISRVHTGSPRDGPGSPNWGSCRKPAT
jgi:hypothetical protein